MDSVKRKVKEENIQDRKPHNLLVVHLIFNSVGTHNMDHYV